MHATALAGSIAPAVINPLHKGEKLPVAAPAVPEPAPAVPAPPAPVPAVALAPAVPLPVPAVELAVPAAALPVPAVPGLPAVVMVDAPLEPPVGESFEPEQAAALKQLPAAKVSTKMRVVRSMIPRKLTMKRSALSEQQLDPLASACTT